MSALTDTFRALHRSGTFVMPNPWDVGSARYLEWRGFKALATTSSGFAATLGRLDHGVSLDELLAHVEAITAAVSIPLNVDSERLYANDTAGIARTVELLASAGAAGCSIEDYDPATGTIDELPRAVDRVAAAAQACAAHGLVLTARTEQALHGAPIDATIARLRAFHRAGAEVVFGTGAVAPTHVARLVAETGAPVNVLALPGAPSVPEMARLGVRRISTGGGLANAALGGLRTAVDGLLEGSLAYLDAGLSRADRSAAFTPLEPRNGG